MDKTRKEAKEHGERYYFTGKTCKNGHTSTRLSSNGSCIECKKEEGKRFRANNPEKCREYCRQYSARNPEYFKAKSKMRPQRESRQAKENRIKRRSEYYQKNKDYLNEQNRAYRTKEKEDNPAAERIRSKKYRELHPERRADLARKRRAIKNGAKAENIISGVVFNRDNWMCQICGEELNKNGKMPGKNAPTVDHIIPLSRGGSHTYDNVQSACYICNCKKGNR